MFIIVCSDELQRLHRGRMTEEEEKEFVVKPTEASFVNKQSKVLFEQLKQGILQAHVHDPTLQLLPRRHDPVLWWLRYPGVIGVPEHRKQYVVNINNTNNIIL